MRVMDVASLRKSLNLTQAEFAAKLGTTATYVGHLEQNRRRPSLKLALKIEELTGVDGFVAEVVADKLRAAHQQAA